MLDGIQNTLRFLNNNWSSIIIIIGLAVALWEKIKDYLKKSKEERVEAAKAQIKESMLKWITDAEVDYEARTKAGDIKRSQVIQKIFAEYPVLAKVTDQETIIKFIDETINESLKSLRKIVAEQPKAEEAAAE